VVNTRKPPSVAAAPTPPAPLLIGSAEDAEEAFGPGSAAGDLLRLPRGWPVVVVELAGGGVALPQLSTITVEGIGWPELPGAWAQLRLEHDPQRSPPVRCTIDGKPFPLARGADGIWRPKGTAGHG
jgi:hypothetical protein